MNDNWYDHPPANIRDFPGFDAEYIDNLQPFNPVIHLPNVEIVLDYARQVFESSRLIDAEDWQNTKDFICRPNVKHYLKCLLIAYKALQISAIHSTYYCAWLDQHRNVCGALMDIHVEQIGAFYICRVDGSHRTQVI